MKQISEDYVSYETAKLLKEKGFDEMTNYHYDKDDKLLYGEGDVWLSNSDMEANEYNGYSAPTHQMTLKWLREVHNIHIEIRYLPNQFTDEPSYKAMIWDMSEEIGRPLPNDVEYAFYETCVNNAIKYTLENLI